MIGREKRVLLRHYLEQGMNNGCIITPLWCNYTQLNLS